MCNGLIRIVVSSGKDGESHERCFTDPIMKTAMGFMAAKHLFVASEVDDYLKLLRSELVVSTSWRKGLAFPFARSALSQTQWSLLDLPNEKEFSIGTLTQRQHSSRARAT